MKTKLFLAVACLLFFAVAGHTQEAEQPELPDWSQIRHLPVIQHTEKVEMQAAFRTLWSGQGTSGLIHDFLRFPEVRTAWGVSDEQYQRLENSIAENPVMLKQGEDVDAIVKSGVLFTEKPDEKTLKDVQNFFEEYVLTRANAWTEIIDKGLAPEQKQVILESMLANMAEIPIPSPGMFEVLDLTDEQKQQMEKIKKELEPEFEKTLENYVNGRKTLMNKVDDALEKEGKTKPDLKTTMEMWKQLSEKDPAFKKINDEIHSQGKAFVTRFKIKMFDVLTDEQWKKLQKLIDAPPEHAKVLRKKLREQQGQSEESKGGKKADVWVPGPGAWQPGSSAIPEQYRQERNSRFPRGEN